MTDRLNTFTVECPDDEEDSSLQEEVQVRKLAWACRNETVCAPLIGLRKCLENFVKNNSSEICLWIKYTFIALFLVYMGFAFTLKKEFGREGWIRLLVITVVVAVWGVFVFGENYRDHYFAFRVMSTVIFFSATLSVLHYLGVMRVIIRAFAVAMDYTMKTGAMETLHAAFNIFCGWVPANHLVTASFMSAPAALALAKMSYPNDRRALKPVREKDLPRADCKTVGRLLGLKIFANEYVAYSELGIIRANRLAFESHVNKNGTWNHTGVAFRDVYLVETNTTLPGGVISVFTACYFIFALLVLRTTWGRAAFKWLAARMTEYMNYTDSGAAFVFGPSFRDHFFAFRVMSTIIFFSASISILYYFGVMQVVIKAVSKVMQVTMGTGAMETLHAAINIFCGWVPANHLISASFMSAPAALALSKISFPSDCRARKRVKVDDIPRQGKGVVDAASLGAVAAVAVVGHILVTVIAFISLLAFVNATLEWFGARIGLVPPDYPPLSFQLICSYLMWPVAFLLGVRMPDCRVVARLIGIKIFVNEFVAYADLGTVRTNRLALENHVMNNGTWRFLGVGDDVELLGTNTTLLGGVISPRSETLATYALCGFSDLVALGMMTAALSTVAPSRRPHVLQVAPRALITGITACLLTAAMAGLLVEE
nr:hypothetical protein BaRGS_026735 [Batillaria attramentaria]